MSLAYMSTGAELCTAPYLLNIKLSSPLPRWVNQQNLKRQENTLQEKCKVHPLNDKTIKWFYKKRMNDWLQHNEKKPRC